MKRKYKFNMTKIKNVGVLTSGGDAPGMNAAIRAVVRSAINSKLGVFGIYRGYEGMMDGEIKKMDGRDVSGILQRGGTILKTARSKRFREYEGRKLAFDQLMKHGIDSLVIIGGDGSFRGATEMSQEFSIPVVGIPGTIDNDIFGTDYTIGYDTALNTVIEAVDKIRDTASSHNRVFFIEVMGRDAGFLALTAGIGVGAEAILIPEVKSKVDDLINFVGSPERKDKSSIIMVAEGYHEGTCQEIADKVQQVYPDLDVRVTILGHIQRGGSPSAIDRFNASKLGVAAVEALLDDQKSLMVGLSNNEIVHVPISKTVKMHKNVTPFDLNVVKMLL